MDPVNLGALLTAAVAAAGAWASQRAAAKASRYNSDASAANTKAVAETDAYNRARKMDLETIHRQDIEIDELRADLEECKNRIKELKADNTRLHAENAQLILRVSALERNDGGTP